MDELFVITKYTFTDSSIGIGLFFSAFMLGLTAIQARYTGFSPKNSEEFSSASRSVKPGLIASGIVSAWTWAATLVSSSTRRLFLGQDLFTASLTAPILCSCIQVRNLRTLVVRLRRNYPSSPVCASSLRLISFASVKVNSPTTSAGRKTQAQCAIRTHMA